MFSFISWDKVYINIQNKKFKNTFKYLDRIIVTGGYNGVDFLASAEVYDLSTNEWNEFPSKIWEIILLE